MMNTGLIAVGTGVASFGCSIAAIVGSVAFRYPDEKIPTIIVIGSVATGALGLALKNATLKEGETLKSRDYMIIGGSALVGGYISCITVVAIVIAAVVQLSLSSVWK